MSVLSNNGRCKTTLISALIRLRKNNFCAIYKGQRSAVSPAETFGLDKLTVRAMFCLDQFCAKRDSRGLEKAWRLVYGRLRLRERTGFPSFGRSSASAS